MKRERKETVNQTEKTWIFKDCWKWYHKPVAVSLEYDNYSRGTLASLAASMLAHTRGQRRQCDIDRSTDDGRTDEWKNRMHIAYVMVWHTQSTAYAVDVQRARTYRGEDTRGVRRERWACILYTMLNRCCRLIEYNLSLLRCRLPCAAFANAANMLSIIFIVYIDEIMRFVFFCCWFCCVLVMMSYGKYQYWLLGCVTGSIHYQFYPDCERTW